MFSLVSTFRLIRDLRVLKDTLGDDFGSFLVTLGSIFVVLEGLGNRLELPWIMGPSLDHPNSDNGVSVWLNVAPRGPLNSHLTQIADPRTAIRQDTRLANWQQQTG